MEITKESKMKINTRDKFEQIGSKAFAKRLKLLREAAGITQAELADKLGVSRGTISYYEKAERIADIDFLCKVAALFGVTYDYLLGESDSAIIEYREITEKLNFSDKAVDKIFELDDIDYCFSRIIENENFDELARQIEEYMNIDTIQGFDQYSKFRAFNISELFIQILLDTRNSIRGERIIKKLELKNNDEINEFLNSEFEEIKKEIDEFELLKKKDEEEFKRKLISSKDKSISQKIIKYFHKVKDGENNGNNP